MPDVVLQYLWRGPFLDAYVWPTIWILLQIVVIVTIVMVAVPYLVYAERKVIGAIQLRRGPNVVGPFGLLQPLADGLKLFLKETIVRAARQALRLPTGRGA